MTTGHGDTEQAVLNMLQRYGVMTMDEMVVTGKSDFTWAQVFLAIDRLSRRNLIALSRTGKNYQIALSRQAWTIAQASKQVESDAHLRS